MTAETLEAIEEVTSGRREASLAECLPLLVRGITETATANAIRSLRDPAFQLGDASLQAVDAL